jgi:hypothetical protein
MMITFQKYSLNIIFSGLTNVVAVIKLEPNKLDAYLRLLACAELRLPKGGG